MTQFIDTIRPALYAIVCAAIAYASYQHGLDVGKTRGTAQSLESIVGLQSWTMRLLNTPENMVDTVKRKH